MHLVTRLPSLPTILVVGALFVAVGCGPAISTPSIHDAEFALETARLEDAEIFATYEFVSAQQFLAKAQEEWGYSDFQKAEEYAERAQFFAEAALARARANPERSRNGTTGAPRPLGSTLNNDQPSGAGGAR